MTRLSHVPKFAIVLGLILLLFAAVQLGAGSRAQDPFVSTEIRFADRSLSGLSIIPASCPSNPHASGECDPTTCSMWVDSNPIGYGSGTYLRWTSSSNATSLFIDGYGFVNGSGATWVGPSQSTTYNASVSSYISGGSGTCSATLTVNPPAATCSVSFDTNPINQSNGTYLRWSSANASTVYIYGFGYVNASGAPWVAPPQTTTYGGWASGAGGSNYCSGPWTLYVIPPPSATISADSTSIRVGQSTTIRATFAVGSGDSMTGSAINQPYGTSVTNTSPASSKTYNFGPAPAGTYTFYAWVHTPRYGWQNPATVSVNVQTPVSCTFNGQTVAHNSSVTAFKKQTISLGETCESESRLCTHGSLSLSYLYSSCSCVSTPSTVYSCVNSSGTSGSGPTFNIIRETVTNGTCDVTSNPYATCSWPKSCVPNSKTCYTPPVTGALTALPRIVNSGESVTVSWAPENAVSCTVSRTNGPSWSGKEGSYPTAINAQTTFTLTCDGGDEDELQDDLFEEKTVDIVPTYKEI